MDELKEFVKRNKKWKYKMIDGILKLTYMDDLWYIIYDGNVNGFYVFECYCLLHPDWKRKVMFISPMSEDPDLVSISLMGELRKWLDRKAASQ